MDRIDIAGRFFQHGFYFVGLPLVFLGLSLDNIVILRTGGVVNAICAVGFIVLSLILVIQTRRL